MSGPVYPEIKVKKKLRNGEIVNGISCNSGSPAMVEIAGYTGLDYVVIETEISPINMEGETSVHLARAAELGGLTAIMRVRANDPSLISKALSIGYQGIFVVHVNSKEEALSVVKAAKYPPMGTRSSGPGRHLGRHRYAVRMKEYVDYWNRESIVMFIVESKEGVENLEEIVTVPGIDIMGIGQGDLSTDLGDPGAPRFGNSYCVKAVEKLLSLCTPRGIAVRDFFSDLDEAKKWYDKGIRVFEWGFDLRIFQSAVKDIVGKADTLRNWAKKK